MPTGTNQTTAPSDAIFRVTITYRLAAHRYNLTGRYQSQLARTASRHDQGSWFGRNVCRNQSMTSRSTVRITDKRLSAAFSLVEIMVAVAVLVILTILVAQLTNSATAITRLGTKHIDADTQARAVLDRIGLDIAQMIKRTDIDYYIKQPTGYNGHGNGHGYGHKLETGQQGSDQSPSSVLVPGYYPLVIHIRRSKKSNLARGIPGQSDSSRPSYLMLERMAKGLLWNGVEPRVSSTTRIPICRSCLLTSNDSRNESTVVRRGQ